MNKIISRIIRTLLLCHLSALFVFGQQSESGKLFAGQGATLYYEIRGATETIEVTDEATKKAQFMYYLSMLFYSPEKRQAYLDKVTAINVNNQIGETLWEDMEKLDFTPELAKFRFPALVITGRFDMNVAPLVAYKIHKAMANSRFAVFEHSGHLPFYEEQKEFVRLLEEFLSGK